MEWGELASRMLDFPFWVRRVSQVNRVSSYCKPGKLRGLVLLVAVSILLGANCAFASDITAQKIIDLANADRREKGIGELVENEKLKEAAMAKAEDMIADGYFSHTAPDVATPWSWIEKERYDYNYAGENLAMDFVSAEKVNQAWLESPTHRANILNERYKDIGVAMQQGIINGHSTIAVVQMFGSGDKNALISAKENVEVKKQGQGEEKIVIPALPIDEENNSFVFNEPVITSPQSGEDISGKAAEVFGRAKSGFRISLFDQDKLIATSTADDRGWFRIEISNLEEGKHIFRAESEIISGGKKEIYASRSSVNFIVDTSKPKVEYQLFAAESQREAMVEIFSEKNCVLGIGSERIFSGSGKFTQVFPKQNWLSISLKAEDEAGNKTFKEINLASYYFQPNNSFDIMSRLASLIAPQKVFAAESGREAMRNNLGLAMGGFTNY